MMRAIIPIDHTEYSVTARADSHGGGTVVGGGTFLTGTRCTLTAIPDSGYHFVKWSNNLTQNPYTCTVTENLFLTAHFDPDHNEGIESADGTGLVLQVAGNQVTILGAEGRDVSVYDLMGRCVRHTAAYTGDPVVLPATGVYMVRVDGGAAQRIIIH